MAETTQTGNIYGLSASTLAQGAAITEANEALFDPDRVRATDIVETVAQKADNIYRVNEFNKALQELENRDTSFTDEHKQQTREFLESQRDNLVNSLTTGVEDIDKEGAENAEASLNQVAGDLAAWETIIKEIPNIGNSVGFSSGMTPEAEYVVTEIAKGENVNLKFGDGGEINYEVTMPDGSTIEVTKAEFETVLEQNVVPKDFMLGQFDRNANFVTAGEGAGSREEFNYDDEMANNLNTIKSSTNPSAPSLNSLLLDKGHIPGVSKSIAQLILEDPELQNFSYDVSESTEDLDTNEDGVITLADFKAGDYMKLLGAMMLPENADKTYDMIATLMTNKNQQNFTKGFRSQGGPIRTNKAVQAALGMNLMSRPQVDASEQLGDSVELSPVDTAADFTGGSQTSNIPGMTEDEATFQGDIPAGSTPLPPRRRLGRFMRNVLGLPTKRSQARQASRDFDARKKKQEQDTIVSEQLEASYQQTLKEKGWPQDGKIHSNVSLAKGLQNQEVLPEKAMKVGDMYRIGIDEGSYTTSISNARSMYPFFNDTTIYKPLRKQEILDGKQVTVLYFKKIK